MQVMAQDVNSGWTVGNPVDGIAPLNVADSIAGLKRAPQWASGDRASKCWPRIPR